MAAKFYKLGGKASSFYDPSQPLAENRDLSIGQVKQLEQTERVMAAKKGEGLIELSNDEAQEFISESKKTELNAETAADKKLAQADKKLEEAKVLKKQYDNTKKDLDKANETLEEYEEQIEELKSALEDPEKNSALKAANDRITELETSIAKVNNEKSGLVTELDALKKSIAGPPAQQEETGKAKTK